MTDALDRLRPVFGPDWAAFLRQLRADLLVQRDVLAAPRDVGAERSAAHVIAALAGTAGDVALADAARGHLAETRGDASALLPPIDALLARLGRLAAGAPA
jgi:hypothetical protein